MKEPDAEEEGSRSPISRSLASHVSVIEDVSNVIHEILLQIPLQDATEVPKMEHGLIQASPIADDSNVVREIEPHLSRHPLQASNLGCDDDSSNALLSLDEKTDDVTAKQPMEDGVRAILGKIEPHGMATLLLDIFQRKINSCRSKRSQQILVDAREIIFRSSEEDRCSAAKERMRTTTTTDETQENQHVKARLGRSSRSLEGRKTREADVQTELVSSSRYNAGTQTLVHEVGHEETFNQEVQTENLSTLQSSPKRPPGKRQEPFPEIAFCSSFLCREVESQLRADLNKAKQAIEVEVRNRFMAETSLQALKTNYRAALSQLARANSDHEIAESMHKMSCKDNEILRRDKARLEEALKMWQNDDGKRKSPERYHREAEVVVGQKRNSATIVSHEETLQAKRQRNVVSLDHGLDVGGGKTVAPAPHKVPKETLPIPVVIRVASAFPCTIGGGSKEAAAASDADDDEVQCLAGNPKVIEEKFCSLCNIKFHTDRQRRSHAKGEVHREQVRMQSGSNKS